MVTRINVPKVAKRATRKVAAVAAPMARQAGNTARKAASSAAHNVSHAVSGSLGLGGHRMSKVDTAWLRMDSESNLMMIVGVWVLKPGVSRAALCQRIDERLLKYPRFRQRVEQDATGATWVVDEHFRDGSPCGAGKARPQTEGPGAGGPAGPCGRTGGAAAGQVAPAVAIPFG